MGSGSNSCCNLTAYIDNIAVSEYCVEYYWDISFKRNVPGPVTPYGFPRSPAITFQAETTNPVLSFNVARPVPSSGVLVGGVSVSAISLVPSCTCVEEYEFTSI